MSNNNKSLQEMAKEFAKKVGATALAASLFIAGFGTAHIANNIKNRESDALDTKGKTPYVEMIDDLEQDIKTENQSQELTASLMSQYSDIVKESAITSKADVEKFYVAVQTFESNLKKSLESGEISQDTYARYMAITQELSVKYFDAVLNVVKGNWENASSLYMECKSIADGDWMVALNHVDGTTARQVNYKDYMSCSYSEVDSSSGKYVSKCGAVEGGNYRYAESELGEENHSLFDDFNSFVENDAVNVSYDAASGTFSATYKNGKRTTLEVTDDLKAKEIVTYSEFNPEYVILKTEVAHEAGKSFYEEMKASVKNMQQYEAEQQAQQAQPE